MIKSFNKTSGRNCRHLLAALSLLLLIAIPGSAHAKALFTIDLTSGASSSSLSFDNVTNAFDSLQDANLTSLGLDPNSFNAAMNFRGIPMTMSRAGGGVITLNIPALGVNRTFPNIDELKDFFKKDGGDILDRLFKLAAETTPIDPIAGNPHSMMARMNSTAFDRGFSSQVTQLKAMSDNPPPAGSTNANRISINPTYRSFDAGGYKTQSVLLPMSYTIVYDSDPRQQLTFNLPLDYQDVEGGAIYSVGLGMGYTHPMTKNWILTGAVDYGLTGSMDMGSGGQAVAGSLTSGLAVPFGNGYIFSMGNMVSYSQTLRVTVADYSFDPKIRNTAIKNGVLFYIPSEWLIKFTGIEVFATDTRYFGSKLFNDNYQEFGMSYGLTKTNFDSSKKKNFFTDIRIGVSYLMAKDNNGFTANFGYTF